MIVNVLLWMFIGDLIIEKHLLAVSIGGVDSAIYLFERKDDIWKFINELLPVNEHIVIRILVKAFRVRYNKKQI